MFDFDQRTGWIDRMRADLGEQAAARLQKIAGGERRHIPANPQDGWILRELGPASAEWLARRFGGECLEIPLLETRLRRQRRELAEAVARDPLTSANQLARKHGVHRRTINRIREELRARPKGEGMQARVSTQAAKSRCGWISEFQKGAGHEAAARLMTAFGGRKIYIPRVAGGVIWERVGTEAALWLTERFGGMSLYVPNSGGSIALAARERRALILQRPEVSASRLANELGVSAARVYQIRKAA